VPDPIVSTPGSRLRRPAPEIGEPAVARRRRGWLWAALPVCAAFGLFGAVVWLAYMDTARGPATGEPPLIRAAADPIKLPPEQAEESTAAEGGAIGRLWSDAERADQPERLLPLPEDPLSPPLAAPGVSAEAEPGPPGSPAGAASAPADSARAPASQPADGAAMSEAEAALDRLLAEVAALSQGQGAAAPTQAESAAAARPPQAEGPAPAEAAPSAAAPAPSPAPTPPQVAAEPPAPAETPDRAASQEVREARALDAPPEVAPAPPPVAEAPATEPPAARQPPRQVAAVEDRYRVQLAAVRGEADAHRAWDLFMADLGDVLQDVQPFFERAETANGIFYRVQIGPFASQAAAEGRCEDLKQRNASCFVIRR
jgi:hypothetical protein